MKNKYTNFSIHYLDNLFKKSKKISFSKFHEKFKFHIFNGKNENILDQKQFIDHIRNIKKCINNYSISIDVNKLVITYSALDTKKNLNCFSRNFKQVFKFKDDKLYSVKEYQKNLIKNFSGGVGYTNLVDFPPIAGQPVIKGYLDAARPVFPGNLIENPPCKIGGKNKKTKQKGGGYYPAIGRCRLNVLPQYGAYERNQIPDFVDEVC